MYDDEVQFPPTRYRYLMMRAVETEAFFNLKQKGYGFKLEIEEVWDN